MSIESQILLSNITGESVDSSLQYGSKSKGAGFNQTNNGLHTAVYVVNAFSGSIKIQGTLEMYPAESDWFDILGTEIGGDSTISTSETTYTTNFTGNFVWIRAAYNLQNGTIVSVRYNY